jgi:hypothetical protein
MSCWLTKPKMLSLFQYYILVYFGNLYCLNLFENPNDKREFKLDSCDTKFRHLHFSHTFIIILPRKEIQINAHAFESPNNASIFALQSTSCWLMQNYFVQQHVDLAKNVISIFFNILVYCICENYCLNSFENPNDKREFKLDGCDTKFRHLHFSHTVIIIYQERRYRSMHAFESPKQCINFCIEKHVMLTDN